MNALAEHPDDIGIALRYLDQGWRVPGSNDETNTFEVMPPDKQGSIYVRLMPNGDRENEVGAVCKFTSTCKQEWADKLKVIPGLPTVILVLFELTKLGSSEEDYSRKTRELLGPFNLPKITSHLDSRLMARDHAFSQAITKIDQLLGSVNPKQFGPSSVALICVTETFGSQPSAPKLTIRSEVVEQVKAIGAGELCKVSDYTDAEARQHWLRLANYYLLQTWDNNTVSVLFRDFWPVAEEFL